MAGTLLESFVIELIFKGDRRELDKWDRGIKNLNQKLDNLVRPFTIAGTVGAASLGLIGKAGLDTEKALLRMRAELGLTEDQMRTLREEALRVGSDLPLNTADIVNAQRAYGKLGATFQEIIRDTPAIAGASVATGLQPEQVARYARGIQNIFGGDVQENLDVMLRAANRSAGTFESFGESIQFAGQSAADAGLSFKTYIASLGGTAGAMRTVESVSQGMTAMWARLAKSGEGIGRGGKIIQEAFEGVGISMTDVDSAMDGTEEGFIRLLELINDSQLSRSQLTALLSTLAGDTYSASISFAVQNPEAIRNLLAEAALAPGEIFRQQKTVLSGASGGITIMMAQIDTLLNRLAEFGTLTAIQNFTKAVSALIGWLTKANEETELVNRRWLQMISIGVTALASMLAVAAVLKVMTFALSGFVVLVKIARGAVWLWQNALIATRIQLALLNVQTWLAAVANSNFVLSLRLAAINAHGYVASLSLATLWNSNFVLSLRIAAINVQGFIASLTLARVAQLLGAAATGVATAATWAFNVALLANPITWIVLAIVGLIAALVLLVKNWDTVKRVVLDVWDSVVSSMQSAWARIKSFFDRFGNYVLIALAVAVPFIGLPLLIARNWTQIVKVVRGIWQAVVSVFRDHWDKVLAVLFPPVGLAILIARNWSRIVDVVRGIWDSVVGVFQEHWDKALAVIFPPVGLPLLIARNWSRIVDVVRGVWDSAVGVFRDNWAKVLAILFPVVGLPLLIAQNWGRIVEIVGGIWSRVNDTVRGWIEAIIVFIEELPAKVLGIVKDIPSMIAEAIRDIPGLGIALDVVGKAGELVRLAEGGIVTRPTLGLVGEAGPEAVVPLRQMASLFTAPTMPLPVAPAGAGAVYNSSSINRSASVTINGPINVQTQATNAREIAQHIGQEIADTMRNVAFDFDTDEGL